MTSKEFETLSKDLQNLIKKIPLLWGKTQNNKTDAQLNFFKLATWSSLEIGIKNLSETDKNYFRRRWFLWQCARCDEYLFYKNTNVTKNPNKRSQEYDIEFNNNVNLRFDVKSTVIPKRFRENINFKNTQKLVDFYYENQSKGVRYNLQNRLFIVHYSFKNQKREMYLRCYWALKEKAFKAYAKAIPQYMKFVEHNKAIADCIFIIEQEDGTFEYRF